MNGGDDEVVEEEVVLNVDVDDEDEDPVLVVEVEDLGLDCVRNDPKVVSLGGSKRRDSPKTEAQRRSRTCM